MTILNTDIKLLESERMTDATDGGGRKTSRPIVDGAAGNIFPKVSRLDSVAGRANLRKIYGVVDTENLDTYAGAHAVITDAPDNDRIHVTLFSTGSDFDTRTEARDRIESYVVAGPASRMSLFGRQLNGQKAVLAFQRPTEPLPEVGEVYCLSLETTAGDVVRQQYVRVTDISHEIRVFEDDKGTFEVRVITLQIGSALRYTFEGSAPGRSIGAASDAALLRTTSIADSSNYYGITPLAADADMGDLTIQVDSVYAPLVPSTQRESAIALASPGGASGFVVSGAADYANFRGSMDRTHYFPGAVKPGTVRVIRSGVEFARDDGAGVLVSTGGTAVVSGTVDYDIGKVTTNLSYGSDYFYFQATPAVNVSQPARTRELVVTLANRGTVYSEIMQPLPAPGSLVVDYRALGKWYRLRDNGLGEIGGNDPAHGVGTVEYISGAVVVTLGALPDIGSSVLFSWGSAVDFVLRESSAVTELRQKIQLEHAPLVADSLEIAWTAVNTGTGGAAARAATANAAGIITGADLSGTVNAATGVVELVFANSAPLAGTTIDLTYDSKEDVDPVGEPTVVTGTLDLSSLSPLPVLPLSPGSFKAVCPVSGTLPAFTEGINTGAAVPFTGSVTIYDDGTGLLVVGHQFVGTSDAGSFVRVEIAGGATSAVGTINHSTGVVTLAGSVPLAGEIPTTEGWVLRFASSALTGEANYIYRNDGASYAATPRAKSASLADAPIELTLTAPSMGPVVPGSVVFSFRDAYTNEDRYFFDRGGALYGWFSQSSGAATECGTIDYALGVAKFSSGFSYSLSASSGVVQSLLTQRGNFTARAAQFRTSGSPLRPGSLYVQATALDGSNLSAVADANGTITGTDVAGEVVQDMGVVRLTFDKDIFPSTLRYSTVVLSNLPLNADILGLDPVRLPSDGRVPIFRPADVVVIHNTQSFALPNPATASSTYNVGRVNLSDLWLVDADGDRVLPDAWLANLAAGTVTMAADLDLTGVPQPLVARHRIEEMRQLSDVQINGTLSLSGPLTRDYGAGTLVSSALLFGDLWARVTNLFDQLAWTGVWADTRTGDGATAQYNDIDYPIEVLNSGAVTERWRLHFTSGNPTSGLATFQIIGENLGVVGSANTGSDIAPVNALTGKPYFVMRAAGFGLGWAAGNQIRFNTLAAGKPIWLVRTVLPGATLAGDSFDLQLRGDVD